ncbi:hypothetical protein CPC735_036810 [Coccidioides posadasii C735 delta SOWgp]|uniref:Urease accessory protein UreF n=1 Tax=Coccidioides posadasii (strain C735) TaxID=222929 RepID=C5P272_COCP7|nr:hypothetical protein CPC735_036810 [Coccidioides posadasii C735 delta SOWgp]EER28975.1 hypothetical protein CPC735_036810 [Coccidioides posadasii C735 delta SOWgp]|eukprot:XP_003071120.1 hypothetical protein CPC735_036810 [Coccidioides posadasii C735 delta SOWgp]
MAIGKSREELENEIKGLERQLEKAMTLLNRQNEGSLQIADVNSNDFIPSMSSSHSLFLLSDSALPLGSFAYSSGLESYILHNKPLPPNTSLLGSFYDFLRLSISSIASTTLPYVLKSHRYPDHLETLDNDLDASTPCCVARRASVAQGMALLVVWERSFKASYGAASFTNNAGGETTRDRPSAHAQLASAALHSFSELLKQPSADGDEDLLNGHPNGHLGPLWGVVCAAMGVNLRQMAYVFMLNHAKALLSAAVRASVMGPYQAQEILASRALQKLIVQRIQREWDVEPENAGQVVPVIDLWLGRHELLYSRIFNS